MSTLTKLALGMMGQLRPKPALGEASAGLATVIRAWSDREAIARALGLSHDQQVLLSQTVGRPAPG